MKTLVIHPKDKTTDFLKPIYHGRDDVTVITGGCTKEDVAKAIDAHDHIVMLGHGTPQGLMAMGNFNGKPKKTAFQSIPNTGGSKQFTGRGDDDWFQGRKVGASSYSGYTAPYASGYVIDDKNADQLRGKKLTAIWCNADQFMEWNELDGFYTGMFISDESEAKMIGTADTERWQVEEQNYAFVDVVRRNLDQSGQDLHRKLMLEYGPMAERNAVAKYNLKRFYNHKNSECSRKATLIL